MTIRFRVTIGGVTYNVDVEELGQAAAAWTGGAAHGPKAAPIGPSAAVPAGSGAAAPAAPAGFGAASTPAPTPAAGSPSAEGQPVCAPLPGMIVDVKVAVGQQVKAGDVVAVLEAMKMENDITSPYAGTVKQVLVSKGVSVSMNDPLVVIG